MGLAILGILLGLSVALNALLFGVCAQQIKEKERLERERKEGAYAKIKNKETDKCTEETEHAD